MNSEIEATFLEIDKDNIREKLRSNNASLDRSEYMQRRYNFDIQALGKGFWEWVRVRDEGDKVTMAYKSISPDASIDEQKEIDFGVAEMDAAVDFMLALGGRITNYSETLRETWSLDGVEIDIDTWPHLKPYVEIEGESEEAVRKVAKILGFKWAEAHFCGAGKIYEMKYGVHPDKLSDTEMVRLTFEDPNPFI